MNNNHNEMFTHFFTKKKTKTLLVIILGLRLSCEEVQYLRLWTDGHLHLYLLLFS